MTPALKNGLILAATHALLLCGIGAKFGYDRATYPRAWMKTVPYDPNLPFRGRYINLRVSAKMGTPGFELGPGNYFPSVPVRLSIKNDQVFATQVKESTEHGQRASNRRRPRPVVGSGLPDAGTLAAPDDEVVLDKPLAFFIPEKVEDPSRLKPGEELWVEVTVPPSGPPRPIRLEKRIIQVK
jgi:hypothetical protein